MSESYISKYQKPATTYTEIRHICKRMSDSSPSIQRKPRRKAPVITTSQDSPEKPLSKKTVPPSPGVPPDTAAASKPKRARKRTGRSKKKVSRRQQRLLNPLLDLQAVECDSCGDSLEGSQNSEDDQCLLPPCSSFETQLTLYALSGILQICHMSLTVLTLMGTAQFTLQA
jgi:hypothetical protein